MRIKNLKSGFSFIELMFAVTVLAFGLTGVLHSFTISVESMIRTENVVAAAGLLETKMEEIKQRTREDGGIEEGSTSGFLKSGNKEFQWSMVVTPGGVSTDFNESNLTISWQESNKTKTLSSIAYLKSFEDEE